MAEGKSMWSKIRAAFNAVPRWIYVVLAIGFAIAFPFLEMAGFVDTLWLRVGIRALTYVLLALGLNVVMGETGLLNLGYIAFFAIGAYTTAILASPLHELHIDFWILLVLSIIFAAIGGLLVGLPTLRLRGDYLAIVTLAFGEIIRITMNNWNTLTNGAQGIPNIDRPELFGFTFDKPAEFYYLILAAVIIVTVLLTNLKSSRIGRGWNALREDEIAAEHAGIHGTRMKLLSVVISAGIAGAAGSLFAYYQHFINPNYFVFMQSVLVVCMIVLGGMGSIPGVILGAILLDALPEFVRQAFSSWLPALLGDEVMDALPGGVQTFFMEFDRYRMLFVGLLIVLIVIYRPEGLLPDKLWRREVHEDDPREQERTKQKMFDFEEGKQDLEV